MNKTLIVASLLSIGVVLAAGSCEEGWKFYKNYFYKFVPKAGLDQHDAQLACKKMGGANLASVHSADEHKFIMGNLDGQYWIGLTLRHNSDKTSIGCTWSDGSSYDYGACKLNNGQQPWREKEPNDFKDVGELCVVATSPNGWNDLGCNYTTIDAHHMEKLGYICKK